MPWGHGPLEALAMFHCVVPFLTHLYIKPQRAAGGLVEVAQTCNCQHV